MLKNEDFDQSLECAAPKHWSRYTTVVIPLNILKCTFIFLIQDPNQDETFWNKFGTLGKSKKRAQEVKVVETEGKYAIDSPGMPKSAEMPPEVI